MDERWKTKMRTMREDGMNLKDEEVEGRQKQEQDS